MILAIAHFGKRLVDRIHRQGVRAIVLRDRPIDHHPYPLTHSSRGLVLFEPYGNQHIADVRTLDVADSDVANIRKSVGLKRGQPLVPMLLVLPALFVLGVDGGGSLAEGRDPLGLLALKYGVDSCLNLRADFG